MLANRLDRLVGDTIALDVETLGLKPYSGGLRLLSLSDYQEDPQVIDFWSLTPADRSVLRMFLEQEGRTWVAHSAVFDLGWLQAEGIRLRGPVRCTATASRLIGNGLKPRRRNDLASVLKRYLRVEVDKTLQTSNWGGDLTEEQIRYAAADTRYLVTLWKKLESLLAEAQLTAAMELECSILPAVAHMQRMGMWVDRTRFQGLRQQLGEEVEEQKQRLLAALDRALGEAGAPRLPREMDGSINTRLKPSGRGENRIPAGFNLNSPAQLLDVLNRLGVDPRDEDGKPTVDRKVLAAMQDEHPIIERILQYKNRVKRLQMVNTLEQHLDEDDRIRARFNPLGAESGRFACSEPNLQQVPRDSEFRALFRAPEGYKLIDCDYAQMELRLAAAGAPDEVMIKAFQGGIDLHTLTASLIYGVPLEEVSRDQRQIAKSANFGLLYGSGVTGLRNYAKGSGIKLELEEAAAIRTKFLEGYPGIHKWQRSAAQAADITRGKENASIRIPNTGMRRFLPGEENRLTVRCNTPIQGSGSAILKRAIASLWGYLKDVPESEACLIAVIHDEILMEVREDLAEYWRGILQTCMEQAGIPWLGRVPCVADAHVVDSWAEK